MMLLVLDPRSTLDLKTGLRNCLAWDFSGEPIDTCVMRLLLFAGAELRLTQKRAAFGVSR